MANPPEKGTRRPAIVRARVKGAIAATRSALLPMRFAGVFERGRYV